MGCTAATDNIRAELRRWLLDDTFDDVDRFAVSDWLLFAIDVIYQPSSCVGSLIEASGQNGIYALYITKRHGLSDLCLACSAVMGATW